MNHPVHFQTKDGKKAPSAFIPFCEFGGNSSSLGVVFDRADFPFCNSFEAKILNDQLCYEVDLNKLSNKDNIKKELASGFSFIMDYNEDRQMTSDKNIQLTSKEASKSFVDRIDESDNAQEATIYLDTIGKLQPSLKVAL